MDRSGAYGVWREAGRDGVFFERVKGVVTGRKTWLDGKPTDEELQMRRRMCKLATFSDHRKIGTLLEWE